MNIPEGKIVYVRIDEIQATSPDILKETKTLIAFGLLDYEAENNWPLVKITVRRQRDGYKLGMDRTYIYPAASPSVFHLVVLIHFYGDGELIIIQTDSQKASLTVEEPYQSETPNWTAKQPCLP